MNIAATMSAALAMSTKYLADLIKTSTAKIIVGISSIGKNFSNNRDNAAKMSNAPSRNTSTMPVGDMVGFLKFT